MRLRKRAAGLALGAGILFLLGTNVQAGWLFVLCALLLGTLVSGAILPGRMLRGVEVERRAPGEVVQGEEAFVDLIVTNRAGGVRLGLTLDDPHVAPTSLYVTKVSPGERVELVTVRPARKRGVQEATPVTLRSAAPFGVAERRRTLTVAGSTIVLPPVLPLGSLPFLASASDPSRRSRPDPHRGSGPEYLGIREYRPGDSPRHVHWPSTARTGTVMVRELEEERSQRLTIVVDTLADVGDEGTPLDACCTAAASIARVAFGEGHSMRIISARSGRSVEVWDDVDEGVAPSPARRDRARRGAAGGVRGHVRGCLPGRRRRGPHLPDLADERGRCARAGDRGDVGRAHVRRRGTGRGRAR